MNMTGKKILPAYPVGENDFTDAEKAAQRKNADCLNKEIKNAILDGNNYLKVPCGVYRFNNSAVEKPLTIDRADGLTIDFSESMIYSEDANAEAILLRNCKNVAIKNFMADYDPLPYIQGTIREIDSVSKTVTVEFDDGYTQPDDDWEKNAGGVMKFIYFSPDGKKMISSAEKYYTYYTTLAVQNGERSLVKIGERVYKIRLSRDYIFSPNTPVTVGCRVAIPWRRARTVFLFGCENVTVESAQIYAAPGYCLNEVYGNGGNVYRKISILRRPGTGRLISTNADCFHSSCMQRGPVVENCSFSYSSDDFINIRGYFNVVTETGKDYLEIAAPSPYGDYGDNRTFRIGDRLEFFKFTDTEFINIAELKVKSVQDITKEKGNPQLGDISKKMNESTGAKIRSGLQIKILKVTFCGDISPIEQYAMCYSPNLCGGGAVIRGNDFSDGYARGMIIRCRGAKIFSNKITDVAQSAIVLYGSAEELEPFVPDNCTVEKNTIDNANIQGSFGICNSAITISAKQFVSDDLSYHGDNVNVRENHISNSGDYSIAVNMYNNAVITDNIISNGQCRSNKDDDILIINSVADVRDNGG